MEHLSQSNNKPEGKGRGFKNRRFKHGHDIKKKDLDAVPILKFGPGNNFMRFKEALPTKALEEYGVLGKLIKKGTIDEPPEPNRSNVNMADEVEKVSTSKTSRLTRN